VEANAPLSEQLRLERRARHLLQWVALEGATAPTPDALVGRLLEEICRVTGWPVGHMMRVEEGALVSARLWAHADPARFAAYKEVTEATRFPAGVGLPGRVLESAQPLWVADIANDQNFPRKLATVDLGVRAAFAFPLLVRGSVVAILEFASHEPSPPDEALLEVLRTVGVQVGSYIERATSERGVRAAEQRLRALTEAANDAIVTADVEGRIITWNSAAERLFGYGRDEALGMTLETIIPQRFRTAHRTGMHRVATGGPHHVIGKTAELSALRKDGSELPVELSLATWSHDGERFFTGILRDISERMRAREELEAAAERLMRSEQAAIDASRAKSIFLANMSHELRTPLNAILGFVQLLSRDPNVTRDQQQSLDVILRSGEHLLSLINDVLSIAKIEAGEVELQTTDFDAGRLISGLHDLFHLRAQAKGLRLVFSVDDSLHGWVRGDEGKLRQVLINLLGNALKFTTSGTITLTARADGGRATFTVDDTGPGIAKEEQGRLFEPFTQTAAGVKAKEGTGLGLAISRDFVRLMGGDISVDSNLGRGSRFTFTVPLAPTAAGVHSSARRVIGLAPGEPVRRILVVDNADDNRVLLSKLLRMVGFDVREAENGQRAVELWREFHPDVVWMDMRMPVMDGYDATRAIRVLEKTAQRPRRTLICALTASAFEHDRADILAAGCDDVLSKPFREDVLFRVLEERLGVRFLRAEEEAPAVTTSSGDPLLRLATVEPSLRAALEQALVAGDDLGARKLARQLATHDAPLAAELEKLIDAFRLDQILDALEKTG
jgi:PAS domain S-box-containing protein